MKFIADKAVLLKEIAVAHEIIASKNMLSILSNVYFETEKDKLLIRASDVKVGFQTRISVDILVPGSTTVFCEKLLGVLRSLPEGDVEFEQKEVGRFIIRPKEKKAKFELKSIASEKYPPFQGVADKMYFSLSQRDMLELIQQTVFAVSNDETRFFLNGVFFELTEKKIALVATDGRRLSYSSSEHERDEKETRTAIVPPKILSLTAKMLTGEGNVDVALTDKHIFFRFGEMILYSSLIEGQFPNYTKVIPETTEHSVVIPRKGLEEAVKRVSLFVEQKSRRLYLKLTEDAVVVQSEESDVGTGNEEVACKYNGPEVSIALNCLYLQEPLRVIGDEDIEIRFTEAGRAILLGSFPRKNSFHIIMPMQTD